MRTTHYNVRIIIVCACVGRKRECNLNKTNSCSHVVACTTRCAEMGYWNCAQILYVRDPWDFISKRALFRQRPRTPSRVAHYYCYADDMPTDRGSKLYCSSNSSFFTTHIITYTYIMRTACPTKIYPWAK